MDCWPGYAPISARIHPDAHDITLMLLWMRIRQTYIGLYQQKVIVFLFRLCQHQRKLPESMDIIASRTHCACNYSEKKLWNKTRAQEYDRGRRIAFNQHAEKEAASVKNDIHFEKLNFTNYMPAERSSVAVVVRMRVCVCARSRAYWIECSAPNGMDGRNKTKLEKRTKTINQNAIHKNKNSASERCQRTCTVVSERGRAQQPYARYSRT